MADDNSTAPAAPPVHSRPADLLNDLLNIQGTIQRCRRGVEGTMSGAFLNDHPDEAATTLQSVEGALALAELAIERLYEHLGAIDEAWVAR